MSNAASPFGNPPAPGSGTVAQYNPRTGLSIYTMGAQGAYGTVAKTGEIGIETTEVKPETRGNFFEHFITPDEAELIRDQFPDRFSVKAIERQPYARDTGTGMERMYDLVDKRGQRKFRGDSLFPFDSEDPAALSIEDDVSLLAATISGKALSRSEVAVRMIMLLGGVVGPTEVYDPSKITAGPTEDDIFVDLQDIPRDERKEYMAALGVSYLTLAVAKPFVTTITSAVRGMVGNLSKEFSIDKADLSVELYQEYFIRYFQRVDLRKIAKTLADRKFIGSPWLTSYATRYGAGTSHLTAISTFVSKYPSCPLWRWVPEQEIENMMEAFDKVSSDALALFPLTGEADLTLDKYRVKGMPTITLMAIVSLKAKGDSNWSRYMNLPEVNTVRDMSTEQFWTLLMMWLQALHHGRDAMVTMGDGRQLQDVTGGRSLANLGLLVQTGGKRNTTLQSLVQGV